MVPPSSPSVPQPALLPILIQDDYKDIILTSCSSSVLSPSQTAYAPMCQHYHQPDHRRLLGRRLIYCSRSVAIAFVSFCFTSMTLHHCPHADFVLASLMLMMAATATTTTTSSSTSWSATASASFLVDVSSSAAKRLMTEQALTVHLVPQPVVQHWRSTVHRTTICTAFEASLSFESTNINHRRISTDGDF